MDLASSPNPIPFQSTLPFSETPRQTRGHLKKLSLASTPRAPLSSSSSSPPATSLYRSPPPSAASDSPMTRSATDGALPSSPSPAPLSRTVSLNRFNGRRQSSISYTSPRSDRGLTSCPSSGGLGLHTRFGSEEGAKPMLGDLRKGKDVLKEEDEEEKTAQGSSTSKTQTLVERHADLLSFIAQKESKSLELREQLAQNEAELSSLKKKWQTIVARASRPSTNASSSNQISAMNSHLESSADPATVSDQGIISPEVIRSGKKFLNMVLGGGLEDDEELTANSKMEVTGSPKSTGAMARGSLDMLLSSARTATGLDVVAETNEATLGHSKATPSSSTSHSIPTTRQQPLKSAKRLSLASSTTTSSSLDSRSSSMGSMDSTTSSASSAFSATPTDEKASSFYQSPMPSEDAYGPGEKSLKSLADDMASSGSAGWGKRWNELASGIVSSETIKSSRRATMSLTATLSSQLNSTLTTLEKNLTAPLVEPAATRPLTQPPSSRSTSSAPSSRTLQPSNSNNIKAVKLQPIRPIGPANSETIREGLLLDFSESPPISRVSSPGVPSTGLSKTASTAVSPGIEDDGADWNW